MATNYNITMKQFNGTDYDNLYPAANLSNSIGSIQANQINGQIPASQISGLSTTPNVSNATGTLAVSHGGTGRTSLTSGYYLVGNGTGAVTLQSPSQLQSSLGLDDYAKIQTGSYTGTGTYGSSNPNSLTFNFSPKMVTWFISSGAQNSTYGAMNLFPVCTPNNDNVDGSYKYAEGQCIKTQGYGIPQTFSSRTLFTIRFRFSNNVIYWYFSGTDSDDAFLQLNSLGLWNYYCLG